MDNTEVIILIAYILIFFIGEAYIGIKSYRKGHSDGFHQGYRKARERYSREYDD
jgi:hypothetical protein